MSPRNLFTGFTKYRSCSTPITEDPPTVIYNNSTEYARPRIAAALRTTRRSTQLEAAHELAEGALQRRINEDPAHL